MPANVGRDLGNRLSIYAVILFPYVFEVMLPMKCIHYAAILVEVQESHLAIHNRLFSGSFTVGDDLSETILNFRRHRNDSISGFCFRRQDVVSRSSPLVDLMIDPDTVVFKIDITDRKSAEF